MFLKRMSKLTEKAKQELLRLREEERAITEHLVEVLADVVQASTDAQDPTDRGTHVREVLDREGGEASLLEQCEQVSAHHGDRYQPFLKKFYGSHRKALFRVIKTLDLRSTTSDQTLVDAMNFIIANEHNPKQYLEATLDLSFANKKWQRTILVRRKGKSWYRRQHLETCVFSSLADELKSGDICVQGSEQFADYRDQLLPWEMCEPKVAAYCQQLGLPATAEGLVEHLRTWLTEVAAEVDRTRPGNQELMINEKGEPSLKRLKAKAQPAGLLELEEALHAKIPERHLLDVVVRIERLTGFGRHLSPLSGNEPKADDARARQILAIFAYGTNLGPHQMARHLRGTLNADQIAHINRRHITAEKLDAALRDVLASRNYSFDRSSSPVDVYEYAKADVGVSGNAYTLTFKDPLPLSPADFLSTHSGKNLEIAIRRKINPNRGRVDLLVKAPQDLIDYWSANTIVEPAATKRVNGLGEALNIARSVEKFINPSILLPDFDEVIKVIRNNLVHLSGAALYTRLPTLDYRSPVNTYTVQDFLKDDELVYDFVRNVPRFISGQYNEIPRAGY